MDTKPIEMKINTEKNGKELFGYRPIYEHENHKRKMCDMPGSF